MTEKGDDRRAAALCEQCGSCHVVCVGDDGSVRVIGTNGACKCGSDDYHVLGPDPEGPDEAVESESSPVEQKGA